MIDILRNPTSAFSFENLESAYKDRDSSQLANETIDYLRKTDSNIKWENFEGQSNIDIYNTLKADSKNNPVLVNFNNPNTPRKTKERAIYELDRFKNDFDEARGFVQGGKEFVGSVLNKLALGEHIGDLGDLHTKKQDLDSLYQNALRAGVSKDELESKYGAIMNFYQDHTKDIVESVADIATDVFTERSANQNDIDTQAKGIELYKKLWNKSKEGKKIQYSKLNKDDQKTIDDTLGFVSSVFRDDEEKVSFFMDLSSARELTPRILHKVNAIEQVLKSEQFLGLLSADTPKERQKEVLANFEEIASNLGFDGVAYNQSGMYFIKDGQAMKVEENFNDSLFNTIKNNKGAIALGMAGAAQGFTKGGWVGALKGGAIGSFFGGSLDSLLADALVDKDFDIAQAMLHGAQEAGLSIAADGLLKAVGTTYKAIASPRAKELIKTGAGYIPGLGMATRIPSGNAPAAQKTIEIHVDKQAQEALAQTMRVFGGDVILTTPKSADKMRTKLTERFGENHSFVKSYDTIKEIFTLNSQKEAQKNFIRAIRADESGNLLAFITEAGNASPLIQKNLKHTLFATTTKLKQALSAINLKPNEIQEVFNTLSAGTKESYDEAINGILLKVYDESYKTTLPKANFENLKAQMGEAGIPLDETNKNFLAFVEKSIYNEKGVTFEQLHNANKTLNAYYKQAKDPNFRDFIKRSVENTLREDIKNGIDTIFAQNKELYSDAKALFETALSDYAKMKNTLKTIDKLKVRDEAIAKDKAFNNILKYIDGQGAQGVSKENFEILAKDLPQNLRERFELGFLQNLFERQLQVIDNAHVFDSKGFFEKLEGLEPFFTSPRAKEYIDIAKGFDTLFKNDYQIAKSLSPAVSEKIGSSIATSIEGAVKFQAVKMMFENIVRLLPHIPFAKGLNEKIQGAALRYHIKRAFSNAVDVQDFNLTLKGFEKKESFNNPTKDLIAKIRGEVHNAKEEILEVAQREADKQVMREELATTLQPIVGKDITNQSTGISAQVSQTSIAKMSSDKAVQKSLDNGFSAEQHFQAAKDIQNLYEKALLKQTRDDTKHNDPAIKIHEFVSKVTDDTQALILVKESLDKDARRIYTLELQELQTLDLSLPPAPNGRQAKQVAESLNTSEVSNTPSDTFKTDSTQKLFKSQDIALDSSDEFIQYAKLAGVEFKDEREARQAYKYIQSRLKDLEC